MKYILMLLAFHLYVVAWTQADCVLQYDGNGDGIVNIVDVLGVLSEFSDSCVPVEFTCGNPVMFDDYSYQTVLIGEQCWFKENLRTLHYTNGDSIPGATSTSEWDSLNSGAQTVYGEMPGTCWPNLCDPVISLNDWGRLYNWFAVNDSRGLCPNDWHVPTDTEWITLEVFLGMSESEANSQGWRGSPVGHYLMSSLSDTPYWFGLNTSGFSGLPGGQCGYNSGYTYGSTEGHWWTASETQSDNNTAWERYLLGPSDAVARYALTRQYGLSVRCVRD